MTAVVAVRKVSVVVPTRNRDELLREALASVMANNDPSLELEVLVVDNGEGADTEEIAHQFGVRYLRGATPGASAARNRGLAAATGDLVAFLDDDDVWTPGHLRPMVDWIDEHPDFAGVLGQIQNVDSKLTGRGLLWPKTMPEDGQIFGALLRVQPQVGGTLIRRSAVAEVGNFDESLIGDEDWDFHLRFALAHKVGFMPIPCVLFRARPDGTWDDVQWLRIAPFRRVFWTNVRRAGRHAPSAGTVLRCYLHQVGLFHTQFMRTAGAHVREGSGPAARLALGRAVRVSPLHAAWSLIRDPGARWLVVATMRAPFTKRLGDRKSGNAS